MSKKFSLLNIDENEKTVEDTQQEQLYIGKNVSFAKNYTTPLYGHMFTRTYGVSIDMYDVKKDKLSKVQFEAEVTIRKFPEEGVFEYKIKKDAIYINKRTPKTVVEKLSIKTLEALYPLKIKTTLKNELLEIINHKEILERWQKIKVQLQKEYTGKAITQYISKFETKLHQKYSLLESLKQEVFYTLLFHDIYTKYDSSLQKETIIAFPVLGFKKPLQFKGIQKIHKQKTYYNTANVRFNAQINSTPIQANLNIEYDLNGNTFLLENAIAKCSIKHNEVILKTVQATLYDLKEKPTIHRSFDDMSADIKQRKRAQKKEENKNTTIKQRFYKWLNT